MRERLVNEMAEAKGKLVSCDRCGDTVFLKCTGEGETDGGYTRWNTFETFPDGWAYHHEVGSLCPSCNAEYKRLIVDFKKKVNDFKTGESGNG